MYKVNRVTHERYGAVIEIARVDSGEYETPFQALNRATSLRNVWIKEGASKVRILVDGQIMITKRAESWANEEYRALPKCEECAKILGETVFTHKYCKANLFCSQACSNKNFDYIVSQWDEETECDL